MTEPPPVHPFADLSVEEKAALAASFGGVASLYERYRPGPPIVAVEWMVADDLDCIVDLGAGTGALTRLLVGRAGEVVAVEPDAQMRSVLTNAVPEARAVPGRGEEIPLPDHCADAVVASASWHWMNPVATLAEVARVLVPGGTLAVVWAGPDPAGAFLTTAQQLLAERARDGAGAGSPDAPEPPQGGGGLAGFLTGDGPRPTFTLEIPDGAPFGAPEHEVFTWDVALDADELIGLLGTFSWIITMDDEARARIFDEARGLLREHLGVEGAVTVDVTFRADAWRSRQSDPT